MMSSGRDVSHFFASVCMNLAQDSFEVKVLVYIYLVRTAEQKADEALLSINSFQKDLAHPNPRVRALALRVMSSIRVQVIVPVVILAVRKCAVDVSPYVRKAAAHAIPKVYRLDKSRVEELVEIVETMLRDSTPFVLSSAAAAFTEVCPHRIDLIHRHFRKICRMLVDVDEWGQILLANLLLRYARSQFLRPDAYPRELDPAAAANPEGGEKTLALALPASSGGAFEKPSENPLGSTAGFYSDSSSDDSSDSGSDDSDKKGSGAKKDGGKKKKAPRASAAQAAAGSVGPEFLDDDHRLLLRSSRPLLQSQNAGVVMAVGALHFYLAPVADLPKTLRALTFAMRCKPEAQHVMLKNICTMVAVQSSLFQVHFNSFFVHPADPIEVRGLKLEILTHVATAENAPTLLRELQAYLRSANDEFVALTIRAIGRCAAIMPQIAAVCVRSLLELSLHPSEKVAGEAVVVIRALVQRNPKEHHHIVARLVRRMEMLLAPAARSAVAWLAGGELYCFTAKEKKGERQASSKKKPPLAIAAPIAEEEEEGAAHAEAAADGAGAGSAPASPMTGRVPETVRKIEEGGLDALKGSDDDAAPAEEAETHGAEGADEEGGNDEEATLASETALVVVGDASSKSSKSSKSKKSKKSKESSSSSKGGEVGDAKSSSSAATGAPTDRESRERFFELSFAVLKRALREFASETETTKLQLLNATCKLALKDPARVGPALAHLLDLCAADPSVDIRDRVRVYRAMFACGANPTPLATLRHRVVLCDKPAPALPSPAAPTCPHALGSLSHALEHLAPGYVPLPDHPETQPPSHVRDQYSAGNQDGARGGAARGGKGGGGGFYSDSDSDSDSDSSSGSDYTSDSDSEDDSSDSSDSDSDSDSDSGSSSSAYTSSDDSDGSGSGSESEDESDEEEEEEEEEEAAASDDDDASDDDAGDAAGDAGGAAGDEDAKVKRGEASESEASESSDDEDASDSD